MNEHSAEDLITHSVPVADELGNPLGWAAVLEYNESIIVIGMSASHDGACRFLTHFADYRDDWLQATGVVLLATDAAEYAALCEGLTDQWRTLTATEQKRLRAQQFVFTWSDPETFHPDMTADEYRKNGAIGLRLILAELVEQTQTNERIKLQEHFGRPFTLQEATALSAEWPMSPLLSLDWDLEMLRVPPPPGSQDEPWYIVASMVHSEETTRVFAMSYAYADEMQLRFHLIDTRMQLVALQQVPFALTHRQSVDSFFSELALRTLGECFWLDIPRSDALLTLTWAIVLPETEIQYVTLPEMPGFDEGIRRRLGCFIDTF